MAGALTARTTLRASPASAETGSTIYCDQARYRVFEPEPASSSPIRCWTTGFALAAARSMPSGQRSFAAPRARFSNPLRPGCQCSQCEEECRALPHRAQDAVLTTTNKQKGNKLMMTLSAEQRAMLPGIVRDEVRTALRSRRATDSATRRVSDHLVEDRELQRLFDVAAPIVRRSRQNRRAFNSARQLQANDAECNSQDPLNRDASDQEWLDVIARSGARKRESPSL